MSLFIRSVVDTVLGSLAWLLLRVAQQLLAWANAPGREDF